MSKSLNARCIRRWEVEFKGRCDSKFNPYWLKRDLRGYIREAALTTADCMVHSLAEDIAQKDYGECGWSYDYGEHGWSYEFAQWFHKQRDFYLKEARRQLDKDATNDQIDEEIRNELEAWND
jgi:hypothetical protein